MTDQRAEFDIPGIGVRVKMQDRNAPPPASPGNAGDVRPGHGVISAEDQGDGAGLRHTLHDHLEVGAGTGRIAAVHLHVAAVDHAHVLQAIGA